MRNQVNRYLERRRELSTDPGMNGLDAKQRNFTANFCGEIGSEDMQR